MISRIIYAVIIATLGLNSIAAAYTNTGALFTVTESGPAAEIDIILCLNGKGSVSCQNYRVSAEDLAISTTAKHAYPAAGIKVLTSGYQAIGCTPHPPTGYCLFAANNTSATLIHLNSGTKKQDQTLTFTSTSPSNATVGGTYQAAATATSGLAVTLSIDSSSSSICTINGSGVVTFNAAGTCTVNANQAGNANYNAAPQV